MRPRILLGIVVCSGFLLLSGCFFVRAPLLTGPALVVGEVLGGVGEDVAIPIEVLDFPRPVGGLAVLSLSYDPQVLELREVQGQNGFVVLCFCLDNTRGLGKFILVNPRQGITSGPLGILKGVRLGPGDPHFVLSEIQLVDEANVLISQSAFQLQLGGAPLYWTRRSP